LLNWYLIYINRELRDEFSKLQVELEFKTKGVNDAEIKLKETKAEYLILQNSHQRLNLVIFYYFKI